jgi:hypothetical protein
MDISIIKEWLVPVSTFVTLITASIGGWLALREYRLKVKAEIRLTQSAELEADIKLLKLFTEIMNIAHARGGTQVSEKAIEKLLSPDVIQALGLSSSNIKDAIESAVITLPVGVAAQDAAISAIWVLGNRHEVLKPVAIQALKSLIEFKEKVATPYFEDLKGKYSGKLLVPEEDKK